MDSNIIRTEHLTAYAAQLRREEKSPGTVENYLRSVRDFAAWLAGAAVTKERSAAWKERLLREGYAPATVNARLAALNGLFRFLGLPDCRVKFLKLQRRLFRDNSRELTKAEYARLVETARETGKNRLALLMESIYATGIRVSEVGCLTVEAARRGKAEIALKGKIRTILIPPKLCRKLLQYARQQKTASGAVFRTKSGRELGRRQIWAELKRLCVHAGVEPTKVFPHNLRHLFARVFYRACRDIARLADVLGHSSLETTRLYLVTTGAEHTRTLDSLRLVT